MNLQFAGSSVAAFPASGLSGLTSPPKLGTMRADLPPSVCSGETVEGESGGKRPEFTEEEVDDCLRLAREMGSNIMSVLSRGMNCTCGQPMPRPPTLGDLEAMFLEGHAPDW